VNKQRKDAARKQTEYDDLVQQKNDEESHLKPSGSDDLDFEANIKRHQDQITLKLMDKELQQTNLPFAEDNYIEYLKFTEQWSEEKNELITAYHMDLKPDLKGWRSPAICLIDEDVKVL
jgi:hypothetical protein